MPQVFIEHADRLWEAECENARRLESRVRLLTTIVLALITAIMLRLAWIAPADAHPLPRHLEWTTLIILMAFVLMAAWSRMVWRQWIRGDFHAPLNTSIILLAAFTLLRIMIAFGRMGDTVQIGITVFACWSMFNLLGALSRAFSGRRSIWSVTVEHGRSDALGIHAPQGSEMRASQKLVLEEVELTTAYEFLSDPQWIVFKRTYEAAVDLSERNDALSGRLRDAQRMLGKGIMFGVISGVLSGTMNIATMIKTAS